MSGQGTSGCVLLGHKLKFISNNYYEEKEEAEIKFAAEWLDNQLKIEEDKLILAARKGYYSEILYACGSPPSIYNKDYKDNKEKADFFRVLDHAKKVTIGNIWFTARYPFLEVGEYCIVAHWD
jgi:hypothetical protein